MVTNRAKAEIDRENEIRRGSVQVWVTHPSIHYPNMNMDCRWRIVWTSHTDIVEGPLHHQNYQKRSLVPIADDLVIGGRLEQHLNRL